MPTGIFPFVQRANLAQPIGVLAVESGGTGATTAAGARADLGIGTGGGNADIVEFEFDWTSTSPVAIGLLNAGDVVQATEIQVLTAFNGTNPVASIGTGVSTTRFQGPLSLSAEVVQATEGGDTIGAPVNAILSLTLGASTAGSGRGSVTISRA